MRDNLRSMMLHITRLTRAGRLREATAAIQRALGGTRAAGDEGRAPAPTAAPVMPPTTEADVIDVEARVVIDEAWQDDDISVLTPTADELAPPVTEPPSPPAPAAPPAAPGGGTFTDGTFSNAAGTRPYKLFVPGTQAGSPRALVVMLHGCKQNPDDFAAGTRMNELAQAQDVVVLYPGQVRQANQWGCWNWFRQHHQQRDRGEPSIIAELTRHIMATQHIDPHRVFVAGLSAGGAMAAVMATTYPELYAAVGIHSGLPHAAAHDLITALSAMKHGPASRANGTPSAERCPVPTIVFHGDQDETVHPDNGEEVIAQARWSSAAEADRDNGAGMTVEQGHVEGGHAYTRTLHHDEQGRCDAEHWLVHGSGHAWSGGSTKGSYTDPLGPDASAQMLRFFMAHPRGD